MVFCRSKKDSKALDRLRHLSTYLSQDSGFLPKDKPLPPFCPTKDIIKEHQTQHPCKSVEQLNVCNDLSCIMTWQLMTALVNKNQSEGKTSMYQNKIPRSSQETKLVSIFIWKYEAWVRDFKTAFISHNRFREEEITRN